MNKLTAPVAGLILSAVCAVSSSHAQAVASCSAAGAYCRSQVKLKVPASEQASWFSRCAAAEQQCKSNCNGKTSVFIGTTDGAPHPTGSCK